MSDSLPKCEPTSGQGTLDGVRPPGWFALRSRIFGVLEAEGFRYHDGVWCRPGQASFLYWAPESRETYEGENLARLHEHLVASPWFPQPLIDEIWGT